MSDFMTPDYCQDNFYLVDMMDGSTCCVPQHVSGKVKHVRQLAMYCDGDPVKNQKLTVQSGFVYRLSANGYMDATDWSYASTELEMWKEMIDLFGSDCEDEENMSEWERYALERIAELESQ